MYLIRLLETFKVSALINNLIEVLVYYMGQYCIP